ncbi:MULTISPECIES: hypothetical protein [Cupriavidus]|uniref:hypothetical protein n=1 Tax=Cupriavidus TaxID=106589 RepID=UPI0011ED0D38|nr:MULTISPECIES: hypothetical protein [Cupriavidus]MWL91813.1 hypothetical protein [Cupriavidus sp. SW-Y-13]
MIESANTEVNGFSSTKLPVDRDLIKSQRLLNMIEVVEVLHAPDGERTLWQMLVDAGADIDRIIFRDVDDLQAERAPALQFRVDTSKLKGFLVLEHAPGQHGLRILVQAEGTMVLKVVHAGVLLRDLATKIAHLIDDGTRRNEPASRVIVKE